MAYWYHSVFLGVAPESQCLKLRWCNVWLHVKCMTQRAKLLWNFIFFVMFIQNRPIEVKTILTWHTESDKWNICLRTTFLCLSRFPPLYQYCMLFISAESIPSRNHVRVARLPRSMWAPLYFNSVTGCVFSAFTFIWPNLVSMIWLKFIVNIRETVPTVRWLR